MLVVLDKPNWRFFLTKKLVYEKPILSKLADPFLMVCIGNGSVASGSAAGCDAGAIIDGACSVGTGIAGYCFDGNTPDSSNAICAAGNGPYEALSRCLETGGAP